jgi:hypothetical protein
LVQQTPATQLVHVETADAYTQPCASVEQVASDVALAHAGAAVVHTGSALHVQAAVPAAPVQAWRAPQAAGAA